MDPLPHARAQGAADEILQGDPEDRDARHRRTGLINLWKRIEWRDLQWGRGGSDIRGGAGDETIQGVRAPDELHGAGRRTGQSARRDHPCAVRDNHSRGAVGRLISIGYV